MRYVVLALSMTMLVSMSAIANAQEITRDGSDFNGYSNPGGCAIFVHDSQPTELHVNCKRSDRNARIRYRYLSPLIKQPATFTGNVDVRGGSCDAQEIRYMADTDAPRTGRVLIPAGCYVHILDVTWQSVT